MKKMIFLLTFFLSVNFIFSQQTKSLIKDIKLGDNKHKIVEKMKTKTSKIIADNDSTFSAIGKIALSNKETFTFSFKDNKLRKIMIVKLFDDDNGYDNDNYDERVNKYWKLFKRRQEFYQDGFNYFHFEPIKNDTIQVMILQNSGRYIESHQYTSDLEK